MTVALSEGQRAYLAQSSADITTPVQWASALLGRLGFPVTDHNVQNIDAWETAEGTFRKGWMNPLDTTQRAPGSSSANSVGVQRYPSWDVGLDATAKTLNNGRYATILDDLRAGDVDVQSFASHVRGTPWGSSTFFPRGSTPAPVAPSTGTATGSAPAAQGQTAGLDLNPLNWPGDIADAIGGIADIGKNSVVKAVAVVALNVTFIGAGLALVVLGVMKTADPGLNVKSSLNTAAQLAPLAAAA